MFTLNEDSLANHIGERKIRLDQSDIEKMEKERKEEIARIEELKREKES